MFSVRSTLRIFLNCLVLVCACAQQIQCPAMCICTGRRALCDHVIEYDSILGPFPDTVVEVKISNSYVKTLGPSITGRNVETILVDQCSFTVVTTNTFTDLSKLRSLHIINSEIGHVNYLAFRNISSRADILINNTSIESVHERAFNNCSNLQQLKFEHVFLNYMNTKAISNVQVNNIIFDNVDIDFLKRNFLSDIPEVKGLTIKGSTFRTIEADAFSGLVAVERVLINNSSFVDVQGAALMYLHHVSRLSFLFQSSNVSCSCRSRDLFVYVHFFPGSVAPSVQCKSEQSRDFEGPLNQIDFRRLCSISGNISMPSFATPKPSQITPGQVAATTRPSPTRPSCPAVCRCCRV
ncbi:slit homolog 1 protein-like [Physella acuta]|uniref:slit homolog 1 protein-like n=1 Tax=Physella acuta TaxID=109671 RepID=UPI0027DE1A8C|nr:slit homolog 1 protein-like [Physella acuta]